ncbi:phosphatidylglycerophosphatase A [Candidatus Magnetoovum chiemensis]|nr:phosphatidylglycerophosphatase A [Candidatus Magnetoovum chiemensis]
MNAIFKFIATVGYVGYMPYASGTWGTLAALIFVYILKPTDKIVVIYLIITLVVGTVSAHKAEQIFQKKDSGFIVIDEAAGYLVSILFIEKDILHLTAAFFLFRLFDIAKPPPANYMERIKGGAGVMLDDIMAGIYANAALQLLTLTVR